MDDLNATLKQLVAQALEYPPQSNERRQTLYRIYQQVTRSGKLWCDRQPYYNDALQEMWEYCCHHLEDYDPTVKQVITWLDDELKRRLSRYRYAQQRSATKHVQDVEGGSTTLPPLAERLPAPPDAQASLAIWQQTLEWVQTDPDHRLRKLCFRKRPEGNCQRLCQRRLPPEATWGEIAAELELNAAEAKDLPKWYCRRCIPILREFGVAQGFLDTVKKSQPRRTP
ncbi:hypothetical protein [Spirulina major]|uniref:hypothetical protein n=1 Tax=Spirulina major TaxID=270636 RepID=UPI00232C6029|nr:hypothetical protein [Spirulina major]